VLVFPKLANTAVGARPVLIPGRAFHEKSLAGIRVKSLVRNQGAYPLTLRWRTVPTTVKRMASPQPPKLRLPQFGEPLRGGRPEGHLLPRAWFPGSSRFPKVSERPLNIRERMRSPMICSTRPSSAVQRWRISRDSQRSCWTAAQGQAFAHDSQKARSPFDLRQNWSGPSILMSGSNGVLRRENAVMRNSIDIDYSHSGAIVRDIGERLRASLEIDRELPASLRTQIDRLRQSEGEPQQNIAGSPRTPRPGT
jgi:hypothetical protein